MPHALILLYGDTRAAAEAFECTIDEGINRLVLVDTFRDEIEESVRVATTLGERLWGVRLDTPSELGGVTLQPDSGGLRAFIDSEEIPAHEAFWFAWSQFQPQTRLWER